MSEEERNLSAIVTAAGAIFLPKEIRATLDVSPKDFIGFFKNENDKHSVIIKKIKNIWEVQK